MTGGVKNRNSEYISENYPTTLFRAIYVRNYTRIKEILRPFNVTPSQWRVLANLKEYDGQNVNSLAERSYTDRTNLSRSVAIMEREGLVVRHRENKDQRNILVFLTEKGQSRQTQGVEGQKSVKFCGRLLWTAPLICSIILPREHSVLINLTFICF